MGDQWNDIERRDELLELLYWFEGERFHGAATLETITRFLARPEADVRTGLDDLVRRHEAVVAAGSGEYRLTDAGRREAARRFSESFGPLLGREAHAGCEDPDCDCHQDPAAAAACHAERTNSGP